MLPVAIGPAYPADMAKGDAQTNPFNKKIKREVALLLYLDEISTLEVIELYQLKEDEKVWRKRLAVWKCLAGKRYRKLDEVEQQVERKAAVQRFYGIYGAAVKLATPEALASSVASIEDGLGFEGFGEDNSSPEAVQEPEPLPAEQVTETLPIAENTSVSPIQESIVSESTYNTLMMDLKAGSLENFTNIVKSLKNDSMGGFAEESNIMSNVLGQLRTYDLQTLDLKALKTFIEILERVITLRRKALILPFGHISPDSKQINNNSSHLHLHNHGLGSFNPVKE